MVSTADISLTELADTHLLFPETLRDLTFDHVSRHRVRRFVSTIHTEIGGSDDEGAALTQILHTLVSIFRLERLNLRIDLEVPTIDQNGRELAPSIAELYPVDLLFFQCAADPATEERPVPGGEPHAMCA
jgi:hypothetical protein